MFDDSPACDKAKAAFYQLNARWIAHLLEQELEDVRYPMRHEALRQRTSDWDCAMAHIQSPIEQIMATGLLFAIDGYKEFSFLLDHDPVLFPEWGTVFVPQVRVAPYAADFMIAVCCNGFIRQIVVECDGHQYHEKTKEQAAHDKARDRHFVTKGYRVLRFTGSELYRDLQACVDQVETLVANEMDQAMADAGLINRPQLPAEKALASTAARS